MKYKVNQLLCFSLLLLLSQTNEINISEIIPYPSWYSDSKSALTYERIHKCTCSANQVLINEQCQDEVTLVTALINEPLAATQVIGTEQIKEVFVEDLKCPQNYWYLKLPEDNFALRTSGKLFNTHYGLSLDFSKYCLEHVKNEKNEVQVELRACLPIFKIPRCCVDDNQAIVNEQDIFDSCSNVNKTKANIEFKIGKKSFQMKAETFPNNLKCKKEEKISHIRVSAGQLGQTARLKLTNEGLILAHRVSVVGNTVYIPSPKYCLEIENNEDEVVSFASYCSPDAQLTHNKTCGKNACFRKCCARDEIFDMVNMGCTPVIKSKEWTPTFYNSESFERETQRKIKSVVGFPIDCDFFSASPNSNPPDNVKLLSNGSLYLDSWNLAIPSEKYCIDNFLHGSGTVQEAFICFLDIPEEANISCRAIEGVIYPVLLLISCVFLGITLAVYAIIPDLHAKVQGKCLIASIVSLLSAYTCLAIVQLGSYKLNENLCIILGKM